MYKKIILLALLTSTFTSCQGKKTVKYIMGLYDISKDDKYIVFGAYLFSDDRSSVYRANIDGSDITTIVKATQEESFWNPRYSEDNQQIVFIGRNENGSSLSSIYIANSDGSDKKKLIEGNHITNAFFSKYDNTIIFLKSEEFGKYSPVGKAMIHGTDIYSVNIKTKEVKKLSNLNAYAIFQVSELDSEKLLMFMPVFKDNECGMKIYSKDKAKVIDSIMPSNSPRAFPSLYGSPKYFERYNKFVFMAPYELYVMDENTKIASILFSNVKTGKSAKLKGMIKSFCFLNTQNKVLFYEDKDTAFGLISLDGTGYKKIPINMHDFKN